MTNFILIPLPNLNNIRHTGDKGNALSSVQPYHLTLSYAEPGARYIMLHNIPNQRHVYGKIVVELKAAKQLCAENRAQLMNYLKATGLRLGLLVNFGHYPKAEVERIIM